MNNKRIAILVSGGGRTLQNLLQWQAAGQLPVDIRAVISSRADAGGVQHARDAGLPCSVIARRSFKDPQVHSDRVFQLCRDEGIDLVVMGGYLDHLLIAEDYTNRVVNIHPSLIPAFSGKGFYGLRVHQAAIDLGVKISGCTVHFVDNEFDHGPIIAQRSCAVFDRDTAESLQKRVFELECQLYPEAIAAIARGSVEVCGREVRVHDIV